MAKNEEKMNLPKVTPDDFFTSQEERDSKKLEKIQIIPIKLISNFPNHPYKVKEDDEMFKMAESIEKWGVLHPVLVRPKEDGTYEMISGHRRKRASEIAKKTDITAIVRKMTDEEATILMVDSNTQREKVLPSERAFAYKMKYEAEKKQGKRNDLTCVPLEHKLEKTREKIAKELGESASTVQRYIRLTELIPELLQLVDEERIALRPAVELSFLKEEEQIVLFDSIECLQVTPSHAQAITMRRCGEEGNLTTDKIDEILSQEKANQKRKLRLDEERFDEILPKHLKTPQEREDYIFDCVLEVRKREKQKENVR